MASQLETLLVVQDHDLAIDRLRHQREALPERAELAKVTARLGQLEAQVAAMTGRRDDVDVRERRLADEVASVTARAADVERSMYSGEISSPRELQAMQADVAQLRRHQRTLEDRELDLMQTREELDRDAADANARASVEREDANRLRARITDHVAAIDEEIGRELEGRAALANELAPDLVSTYETCRRKAGGAGAARLVGFTCQGCHLTVPATEVDRMRRGTSDLSFCDNCGCILVLA